MLNIFLGLLSALLAIILTIIIAQLVIAFILFKKRNTISAHIKKGAEAGIQAFYEIQEEESISNYEDDEDALLDDLWLEEEELDS